MSGDRLPDGAWLAALAGLPGMGPARLRAVLAAWSPVEAWHRVAAGRAVAAFTAPGAPTVDGVVLDRWQVAAAGVDVAGRWAAHAAAGIAVVRPGDPAFPRPLRDDHEGPALLFVRGTLAALDRPRVAVVGTRRCTGAGRAVARELGHDLAAAGVCMVSGLALGIDGAAHAGALAAAGAAPAAVVASGLDVVYPRRHAELWASVAAAGAVLSEYPVGTPPDRWRFPARNRLIAALADVVVVVESHARGGSLHTVDAALERDRPVLAVPGPVRSPASAGTNDLLAAGSAPARDATDVLLVLGLDAAAAGRAVPPDRRPPPDGSAAVVLEAVGWEPATLEQVAARLDSPLGPVAVHLAALEAAGWLVRQGGWFERAAGRADA